MDERSHQQHRQAPPPAAAHGSIQHAPTSPWPGQPAQPSGAPIAGSAPFPGPAQPHAHAAGHAQMPQPPASHQFQYAASGFVLPGAPSGHAPMSAHGGTIGGGQHAPAQGELMPLLNGHDSALARQHAAPVPYQHGAAVPAPDPYGQPHAWAFPTAHGMQLVHPEAVTHAPHHASGAHGHPPASQVHPTRTVALAPGRRRMRWETIVPAAAVACLLAAIGLFISDFDRITGRSASTAAGQAEAQAAAADDDATEATDGATAGGDGASEVVREAAALFEAGRFDEAANLLHPVLDVEAPDPAAVALHDRVDAAAARNRALLARLQRERRAKDWPSVVATIGELERLRPLSADLVALRTNAGTAAATGRTVARARAMMRQGREAEALTLVERALARRPNRALEALREQLSATRAAPSRASRPTARGGGAVSSPPASGGRTATTAPVRPPANVPAGAIPSRPDAPNPVNAQGAGAAAVGGAPGGQAAGTDCHEHDGVFECH